MGFIVRRIIGWGECQQNLTEVQKAGSEVIRETMVAPSRYWTMQIINAPRVENNQLKGSYKSRPVHQAQEFFRRQFPELASKLVLSPEENRHIQVVAWKNFRSASDIRERALAGLCLRCYVSQSIVTSCREIAWLYDPESSLSLFEDLLSFVLDDDGKTLIILDDEYENQLKLTNNNIFITPLLYSYKLFTVEIWRTFFKPGNRIDYSISKNWIKKKILSHPEIKDLLSAFQGKSFTVPLEIYDRDTNHYIINPEIEIHNYSLIDLNENEDYEDYTIIYSIQIYISSQKVNVGEDLEISVHLNSFETRDREAYIFEIPYTEAIGTDLNIILIAPDFYFDGMNITSIPFDLIENSNEEIVQQSTQTTKFRLTALRQGIKTISADLYCGDIFKTTLNAKVQVTGFDETSFTRTRITTQPRPVPQPDFILRVQTAWKETNSACRFQYQLRSFRLPSLFPGETNYHSETLSSRWIEQMRGVLGTTLENISDALAEDSRSRLTSLGHYLFQHLLPTELQNDLHTVTLLNRTFTLLILADQDASLPWELLHDGQRFLSDRFIIGRWFWELNDTRPHEFPVGAINVAHYADVEQPELWTALLEPPGSPPPLPLPEGVLSNLDSTEAMRGLHLIRYSQSSDAANRRNAPVTLDDTNNAQDIERQMRPAKLNLRRNRPLVSLGYLGFSLHPRRM